MGGPMGVYDHPRLPYLRSEMRLIEQTLKRGLPVLGVCLGSQLLAQVLGSDVRPSGYQEIGWYPVTLQPAATREPAWATLPRRFHAFHWHGDAFDLPPGTELLASSDLCPVQAFRAAGSAWGIQFHLEVTAPMVEQMLATWPEELAAAGLRGEEIARASHSHLPGMREVARKVFSGWAAGLA